MIDHNTVIFTKSTIQALEARLKASNRLNNITYQNRVLAILWWGRDHLTYREIAAGIGVSYNAVATWIKHFVISRFRWLQKFCYKCGKLRTVSSRKKTTDNRGRPSKLDASQRDRLKKMILTETPESYGFRSACWDSTVISIIITKEFSVNYSPKYIPQLLKSLNLSYQKAKFVAAKTIDNKELIKERKDWDKNRWPAILQKAKKEKSVIVFVDEVTFRQWGSLSYTWGEKGKQPKTKTCGKRKNLKYFGGIELFEGRFHYMECEGRMTKETYIPFLKKIAKAYRRNIIIVEDGAPYHKAGLVKEYVESVTRLSIERLPAYSPEKNPIERMWRNTKKDATHLKYFATLEELRKEVLITFEEYLADRSKVFCVMEKLRKEALEVIG